MTTTDIAERFFARFAADTGTSTQPSVLFVDGRSGSGKTTLAQQLAVEIQALSGSLPQTLAMDDLYPGWDGLAEGSASLVRVLETLRYRPYDWEAGAFGSEQTLDPGRTLIVEGCGSITARAIQAASNGAWGGTYRVWVACPAPLRRARALVRDGAIFTPHWDAWAAQERDHFAAAQPIARVNEILHISGSVDGTATSLIAPPAQAGRLF